MATNDEEKEGCIQMGEGCDKMMYSISIAMGIFSLGAAFGRSHPVPASTEPTAAITSNAVPRNRVNYHRIPQTDKLSVHLSRMDPEISDTYLWGLDHDENGSIDEVVVLKSAWRGRTTLWEVYKELDKYNAKTPEPKTLEHYVSPSLPQDKCVFITEFTQELTEERQRHFQYLFEILKGK